MSRSWDIVCMELRSALLSKTVALFANKITSKETRKTQPQPHKGVRKGGAVKLECLGLCIKHQPIKYIPVALKLWGSSDRLTTLLQAPQASQQCWFASSVAANIEPLLLTIWFVDSFKVSLGSIKWYLLSYIEVIYRVLSHTAFLDTVRQLLWTTVCFMCSV